MGCSSAAATAPMRKLKLPIPTTIVTGSLGVGKTTALCSLVSRKPADEHWCIIVNEFGAVGIDAVALHSSAAAAGGTVAVRQIAGGCMCCAQSGVLLPAIAQIIRQTKPDRLLVEPSGLGHPAGLLDILQGPHLGSSLQLNAVICLVDLSSFDPARLAGNPTAWDQINVADVLVGSKADAATPAAAEAFKTWACEDLFPPKAQVLLSANGNLDLACLSVPRSAAAASGLLVKTQVRSSRARQQQAIRVSLPPAAATADAPAAGSGSSGMDGTGADGTQQQQQQQPHPGQPVKVAGQPTTTGTSSSSSPSPQHSSCGWVFDESDIFDRAALLALLQLLHPEVARVKGVFRVGPKQWLMPATGSLPEQPPAVSAAAGLDQVLSEGSLQHQQQQQQQQGSADSGGSRSRDSSSGAVLQLQEVCYRGPSMVEVILPGSQQGILQVSTAVAEALATLQGHDPASTSAAAAAGSQQQQQQQPQGTNSATTGSSDKDSGRDVEGVSSALQGLQLSSSRQQAPPVGMPASATSHISTAGSSTPDGVWLQLESVLLACLKRSAAA